MTSLPSRRLALAGLGLLIFTAAPAVSLAEPQKDRQAQTGGLARTEGSLGHIRNPPDMPPLVGQQEALDAYHRGLEYRDKAWKLEEQAAAAKGRKAARKAAKAHRSHEKAIEQFRKAIERVPKFAQALGGLGYALLKTGQYEEALEAYDRALAIGPRYPEAIEERGEAYLGLDRIEEAKSAYIELVPIDGESAAALMSAMRRWLAKRRGDAGGLSEEAIESFAVWIEERSEPVAQVGTLDSVGRRLGVTSRAGTASSAAASPPRYRFHPLRERRRRRSVERIQHCTRAEARPHQSRGMRALCWASH